MSYESATSVQAELRTVRGSTIERKNMSTKTTFKRIALVAVAALGFGVLSVAPSNAALGTTDAIKTTFSATGAITGTTADPFAIGSAISLNVIVDLKDGNAAVTGETFTITYNAYNPKGETITGVTLVETSTSVSLLGNGSETGTVKGVGNTLEFKDTITATARTVATLTIPAAAITAGGAYKVYATKVSGSSAVVLDATSADGTTSLAGGLINVAGARVTQGTVTGTREGNAVTGNNARMKFFFPKGVTSADVFRITNSGVGTILSVQGTPTVVTASAVAGTTYAGGINLTAGSTAAADVELNLSSDVEGVQTLTLWKQNASTGVLTSVFTGTVTWGAAPTYVDSTAFLSTTTTASATADALATARKSSAIYSADPVARISVKQYTDAAKTIQTAGTAKAVVVTISGAGAVDTTSGGTTRGSLSTVAASATALTDSEFYVFPDGRAGAATIAITVNGVALKSYTWSFTGTATSLKEDAVNSPEKSYIGVGETGTLAVMSYDANNVLVSDAPSVNATSDTATVATVSATGTGSVTVTGVKAGKTNINICVGACSTATVKLVIPVEITAVSAASAGVTMAFDKASYEPGEKMVLTVSAVDANGRPVADGDRALFSAAVTANVSFGGASVALPGTSVALAAGVKTYTLYAPSSSGTVTVTGKEGAAVALTEKAAGTAAGVAYVAKTITASAVVLNSAVDAATDAANEAVDAANAATDAALAAAEAADAATSAAQEASDAVAALSESVTKLIAGLQSQIKSLAAVVAKIARKVKA